MKPYAPGDSAWYALRRTLPPWSWERNLEELLAYCRAARIDEVIIKVDTEEFSHNQVPLDWFEAYLPALKRIGAALVAEGVYYSLNPWITQGHLDRGRDSRVQFPDMQMMVGHEGVECRACACPLSRAWREHTRRLWRRYAETGPTVIWVEDDIRTFNHTPIRYGCFCPLHLDAFATRVGRPVPREELVASILAPGEPHPWRAEWLRLQGDIMVEVAGLLAQAVHEVDPEIMLGLMSSGPDVHCLEGRRWPDFARALQGQARRLCSRPPLGIYAEYSLRDFYYGASSIRKTRRALPPGVLEVTEVENVPFTTFAKSATLTGMQLMVSHAMGCHGVTMNLYDHLGSPLADSPEYGAMLAEERSYLDGLASRSSVDATFRGVGLLQRETASFHRKLVPGADDSALADDGMAWAWPLEALGIAVTWDAEDAPVVALSGQTVRAYRDDEVRALLGAGVLCDLSAAETLTDLGYGAQLGVTIEEVRPIHAFGPLATEELLDAEAPRYLTATIPNLATDLDLGRIRPAPGARVLSRLVDMDRRPWGPLLTTFENEFGGRVAVLPYNLTQLSLSPSFLHPYRRAQLWGVLEWLARGPLPLVVEAGAWALPLRADSGDVTRLTLFNLSLDPWPTSRLHLSSLGAAAKTIELLDDDGRWRRLPESHWETDAPGLVTLTHHQPLTFRRPGAWRVVWE